MNNYLWMEGMVIFGVKRAQNFIIHTKRSLCDRVLYSIKFGQIVNVPSGYLFFVTAIACKKVLM